MNRIATAGELALLFAGMPPETTVDFRIEPWRTTGRGVAKVNRDPFGIVTIHLHLHTTNNTIPVLTHEGESA